MKQEILKEYFSAFFTEAQINAFFRKKWTRVRNWSAQDYCFALTLKTLSARAYRYVRNSRIIPLPGVSNIRHFFQNFQIPEGYLETVDKLLAIEAAKLTRDCDRVVSVNFDEVHLRQEVVYDNQEDRILAMIKRANVMQMRGIFKNYKVPIW